MGAYRPGTDPAIDAAIACHPAVMEYIRQDADQMVSLGDAVGELTGVFGAWRQEAARLLACARSSSA